MRKRGLKTIHHLAQQYHEVIYIGSDVGKGTLDEFKNEFPSRFLMEGISEGHVIGMAAGLAMNGKKPYVNTIATFLTRRCYDQICVDLCMGNHNVCLYGNGGGMVYAPLGPTHMAIEDIATMSALPNMTVLVPCDAEEMERAVLATYHHQGPVYIRVGRGGEAVVSKPELGFQIGKALVHSEHGDILLVTTGVMLQHALEVKERLSEKGMSCAVVHFPTIKPFDAETLMPFLNRCPFVFSIEEHSIMGGLGSNVALLMSMGHRHPSGTLKMFGIPDCFPDRYGKQAHLFSYYGLDPDSLTESIVGAVQ